MNCFGEGNGPPVLSPVWQNITKGKAPIGQGNHYGYSEIDAKERGSY